MKLNRNVVNTAPKITCDVRPTAFATGKAASVNDAQLCSCPCGSNRSYKECCSEIHKGAWAHTAVELGAARFSARILGLTDFLADTTHPESLDLIGSKRQLIRQLTKEIKKFQNYFVSPIELCHGEGNLLPNKTLKDEALESSWLVVIAFQGLADWEGTNQRIYLLPERYLKLEGKWMYYGEESEIPVGGVFANFMEKYYSEQDSEGPMASSADEEDDKIDEELFSKEWMNKAGLKADGSKWAYSFELIQPSYAPHGTTTEDQVLGPWLWDELAAEDGEPAMLQPGQDRPRRRQLVYLDDYCPASTSAAQSGLGSFNFSGPQLTSTPQDTLSDGQGEMLSVKSTVRLIHEFKVQLSGLRNPEFNEEVWMFRTGRYR
ncbi:hypothetical protein CEUSTIGMA_g1444.t1 [Chlamydomonas eustigma]|uniref:Uncharacterized protein n=1 Tax=Chlamydomonas eustigma TaxID=1157962 RepID=A0A250WT29_9CHLO|nr:hypothetical protein CEUSTIGMA_g1444.t1 [Chlamydomonas eustigma]|eukprot:GAX73994.1 hypothetical protein CEUSTIGMA_g1444.t1 [Chlamydomonas eustigma]